MTTTADTEPTHTPQPSEHTDVETVYGVATAYLDARALHTVTDLGVADALDDAPATAQALASTVHADPDALERLLRLLADHDVSAATAPDAGTTPAPPGYCATTTRGPCGHSSA